MVLVLMLFLFYIQEGNNFKGLQFFPGEDTCSRPIPINVSCAGEKNVIFSLEVFADSVAFDPGLF